MSTIQNLLFHMFLLPITLLTYIFDFPLLSFIWERDSMKKGAEYIGEGIIMLHYKVFMSLQ